MQKKRKNQKKFHRDSKENTVYQKKIEGKPKIPGIFTQKNFKIKSKKHIRISRTNFGLFKI